MNEQMHNILLLALGNDILGDDAAGLIASRELQKQFPDHLHVVESPVAGFALLDYLVGYDKVLILDSVVGDRNSQGSVHELSVKDFAEQSFSSPHFVGLRDVIELANRLDVQFPTDIRILAITICDPCVLREGITEELEQQLPRLVNEANTILRSWIPASSMESSGAA